MKYLENQVAEKKGALTKVEGLDATFTKVAFFKNCKFTPLTLSSPNSLLSVFSLRFWLGSPDVKPLLSDPLRGAYNQNTFCFTIVPQLTC